MADLVLTARAGEPLDALIHRTLGRTAGVVEQALAANPDLAADTHLAEGQAVTIPGEALAAQASNLIDLWD